MDDGSKQPHAAAFGIDDLLAIQKLVYSYPRRLDSGDFTALGQLFSHAAVYFGERAAPIVRDPERVTRQFADFVRLYDGSPRCRHMICNLIIEPQSPHEARATSSVIVLQDAPGVPLQPIATGDYHDRFAKVDGTWQFSERRITNDMFGNLSAHGKYEIP